MARLDIERQERLEPVRIDSTSKVLEKMGFEIDFNLVKGYTANNNKVKFQFYPYSGWWSGRGIGSGRGFKRLLKKLKEVK